jgi:hypothetical protein
MPPNTNATTTKAAQCLFRNITLPSDIQKKTVTTNSEIVRT